MKHAQYQSMLLLVTGGFILAFQDALVKFSSEETSFWQFQTLRSGCNFLLLLFVPVIFGKKLSVLIPKNIPFVALRSIFLVLCMFCFFCAAPVLTFTQMTTGLYTYPLFVVIFAICFLKERMTSAKMIALVLGLFGASLVLKPWDANFSMLQIFPILAGFFYACNLFILRKYCSNESPFAMTAAVAVGFMISGLLGGQIIDYLFINNQLRETMPFIAIGWPELSSFAIIVAAAASLFNLSGNLCLVKAYQTSESSFLAPLDFLYLVFAIFWGKIMFNTLPDFFGFLGISFILLSGVTVTLSISTKRV